MNQLPTDQRARLIALVHWIRPRWDQAGISDTIVQLAPLVTDAAELGIVLLEWARNPKAEKPHGALTHVERRKETVATVHTLGGNPPRSDDPVCKFCGSRVRRPDGSCLGCWQDQLEDRDSDRADRPCNIASGGPPPAEAVAFIERLRSEHRQRRAQEARR